MTYKRKHLLMMTFLMFSTILMSCGEHWDEVSQHKLHIIGVEGDKITFEGERLKQTIVIESDVDWKIDVIYPTGKSENWLDVYPLSGKTGDTVSITATPYPEFDKADLLVSVGEDKPREIHVTNRIKGFLEVDQYVPVAIEKVTMLDNTSLTSSIRIKSNAKWEVTHKPKWCQMQESGDGTNHYEEVSINCQPYIISDEILTEKQLDEKCRTDSIVFHLVGFPNHDNFRKIISISQMPSYYMNYEPSASSEFPILLDADEPETKFEIHCNVNWGLVPEESDWLRVSMTTNKGTSTFGLTSRKEILGEGNTYFKVTIDPEKLTANNKKATLHFFCKEDSVTLRYLELSIIPK